MFARSVALAYLLMSCCFANPWAGERKWHDRRVLYQLDSAFKSNEKQTIHETIDEIETHTCVYFKEKTSSDNNYLHIVNSSNENDCRTDIGMPVNGKHTTKLGPNCRTKTEILHQLMHAIGFGHEHQRKDRNQFVIINTHNIHISNANKFDINNKYQLTTPYDYFSVMHFKEDAFQSSFAKEPHLRTIQALDTAFATLLQTSANLSFFDIMAVNTIYACDERCPGPNPCRVHSFRGKDCKCYCDVFAQKLAEFDFRKGETFHQRAKSLIDTYQSRTRVCTTKAVAFLNSDCGRGWTRQAGHCYMFTYEFLSWSEASDRCVELGGRLLSIRSVAENTYVHSLIPETVDKVWLNIKRDEVLQHFVWINTGEEIRNVYANWDDTNSNSNECWVMLRTSGKWNHISCENHGPVGLICKKNWCPDGWERLNDNCYHRHEHQVTWQQASDACKQHGAILATPRSRVENEFLENLLPVETLYDGWLNAKQTGTQPENWAFDRWDTLQTKPYELIDWWPFPRQHLVSDAEHRPGETHCLMVNGIDQYWFGYDCLLKSTAICQKPCCSQDLGSYSVIACDLKTITLKCKGGAEIKVRSALYGRTDSKICLDPNEKPHASCCISTSRVSPSEFMANKCDGKQQCAQHVSTEINGWNDPCPGYNKYMQVEYDCVLKT